MALTTDTVNYIKRDIMASLNSAQTLLKNAIAELNQLGFTVDAAAVQAVLDSLVTAAGTTQTDLGANQPTNPPPSGVPPGP